MSWGERSCEKCTAPNNYCDYDTCNVDCPWYKWDGKTKTDSVSDKKEHVYQKSPEVLDFRKKIKSGLKKKVATPNPKNKRFCLNCKAWKSKSHIKKCKKRKG